jgi:DNA ligase (NAD+)
MIDGLRAAGVTLEGPIRTPQEAAPDGPLAGKTIVVTGTLEGHTRESIAELLTSLGAKVTNSITGSTSYLLAGEGGGSKRAKAEKAGVEIIDLDELNQIVSRG